MPSPGGPPPPRLPIEDSYLELLADTLENLDLSARGQFLQRYIRAITHLDLRENQCIQLWDEMLTRRRELSEIPKFALTRERWFEKVAVSQIHAANYFHRYLFVAVHHRCWNSSTHLYGHLEKS